MSAVQRPSRRAKETFVRYLRGKSDLVSLRETKPYVFEVQMARGGRHVATLVDYYLLSESDLLEIREEDPEADGVVNASTWNTNHPSARRLAEEQGVGLFDFKEFMRAVHHAGGDYLAGGA